MGIQLAFKGCKEHTYLLTITQVRKEQFPDSHLDPQLQGLMFIAVAFMNNANKTQKLLVNNLDARQTNVMRLPGIINDPNNLGGTIWR